MLDELAVFGGRCGMLGNRVFLDPNNSRKVICINHFRNVEGAKDFLHSQELQESLNRVDNKNEVELQLIENSVPDFIYQAR